MANIFTIGSLQPLKENYSPIAIGDISKVSKKEWEEHWRQHGSGWRDPRPENVCYLKRAYGGSDMGIIADINNFTPKVKLWATKANVQMAITEHKKSAACMRGDIYETPTAKKYAQVMGLEGNKNLKVYVEGKILDSTGTFVKDTNFHELENPISMYMYRDGRKNEDGSFKYPWALANCDAFVVDHGIKGGLEIKTTSSFSNKDVVDNQWKKGIIPTYYLYQIVYYMSILNLQFWDIICSWGQELNDCAIIRFYRDYDLEDKIFNMVEEFDEYVEQGIQPDVSSSRGDQLLKYYFEMFGPIDKKAPMVVLPEKYRGVISQAMDIDKDIDSLKKTLEEKEKQRAKLYAEIYPAMGNSGYAQFKYDDNTTVGIKLSTSSHRAKLDIERLAADHPEMMTKYVTFDSAAFKKAEAKLNKEYTLPAEPNTDKLPSFTLSVKTA